MLCFIGSFLSIFFFLVQFFFFFIFTLPLKNSFACFDWEYVYNAEMLSLAYTLRLASAIYLNHYIVDNMFRSNLISRMCDFLNLIFIFI